MKLFGPPNIKKMKARRDVNGLIKTLGYWRKDKKDTVCQAAVDALGQIGAPAVEPLIRAALEGSDIFVRRYAAQALRRVNDPRAAESFIAALKGSDLIVRWSAADALGELGDARALDPLIALIHDHDKYLHIHVIEALGKIGDVRATGPLIALLTDGNLDERQKAGKALVQIGAPSVELLVATLKKDTPIQYTVIDILVEIGTSSVAALVERLKDGQKEEMPVIVQILDRIGWQPGKDDSAVAYWIAKGEFERCIEIGSPAIEPLVATLTDSNPNRRQSAAKVLGQLGWQPGQDANGAAYWIAKGDLEKCVEIGVPAIEPLISVLPYGDPSTRQAIAESLARIGAPAVEALCVALNRDKKDEVRWATAEALGRLGDPSAVEALCSALKNNSTSVSLAAAESLSKIGAPAVESLIGLLKGAAPDVRQYAAVAAGKLGDLRFIEPLSEVLNTTYMFVHTAALDALIQISAPQAVETLVALLKDSSLNIRRNAAESLKRLYHSGTLNEESRKIIFAQRLTMEKIDHTDMMETQHNPACYGPGYYEAHTDSSTGGVFL